MGEALAAERRAVFEEITRALGDDVAPASRAWWQYLSVIAELGDDAARQLVTEVHAVEAAGGMTVKDGSRRRTPGGVFFARAYERLGAKRARAVRAHADRRFQQEMLRKFLKLLVLVVPASAERAAVPTEAAASAPALPPERVAEAPTAKAKTPAPERATKPAQRREPVRRPEPGAVEVVVVRRRPAAGASPAAKPGPSTPGAGG